MAIRRQDLAVVLFNFLGYSKIRNLILRSRRKAVSRFVTFHDVPQDSLGRLEANLRFLKRQANVVSMDDFAQGGLSLDKINVVLTFDDGYKSWVTSVAPLLKKLQLPATFFVASGFVGVSREEEAVFMRTKLLLSPDSEGKVSGLSEGDVRSLAEDGFTIGGHTVNHCNLADLRDGERLTYEIIEDKRRLEHITGVAVRYFAYPFGACGNPEFDLERALKEAGYSAAVTTLHGFNSPDTNRYLLHRELTPISMSEWAFRARALGNYDAVQFLKG